MIPSSVINSNAKFRKFKFASSVQAIIDYQAELLGPNFFAKALSVFGFVKNLFQRLNGVVSHLQGLIAAQWPF
jgi:hypothetical protein